MIKYILLTLYRKSGLFPKGIKKVYTFGDIKLSINLLDLGGTYYNSRKSHEEKSSKLYDLIQAYNNPGTFLDIGANYGYISVIASRKFPQAKIIAVEPSKILIHYIHENFKLNNVKNFEVINAICGDSNNDSHSFSNNPSSSQDNRVIGTNNRWSKQTVPMYNINTLLEDAKNNEPVFIKIDTQGYEPNVFKGAEKFLSENDNWIIKSEFGPHWIESQGGDPEKFLRLLISKYDVVELPATIPFLTSSIESLFQDIIKENDIDRLLSHIIHLNRDNRGWVDLLIRPKKKTS